jgi:hypothetical protein
MLSNDAVPTVHPIGIYGYVPEYDLSNGEAGCPIAPIHFLSRIAGSTVLAKKAVA